MPTPLELTISCILRTQKFWAPFELPSERQVSKRSRRLSTQKQRLTFFILLAVFPLTSAGVVGSRRRPTASRQQGRESGSMEDSGLWEACSESRLEMQRKFPTPRQPNGNGGWLDRRKDHQTPEQGLVADQCGVTRRFTFMPPTDLFVFYTESFIAVFENLDHEADCVSNVPVRKSQGAAFSTPPDHGHSPM